MGHQVDGCFGCSVSRAQRTARDMEVWASAFLGGNHEAEGEREPSLGNVMGGEADKA